MDFLFLNQFYNACMNCCICIFVPAKHTLFDDYSDFINDDDILSLDCSDVKWIIDSFAVNGKCIQITITHYMRDGVVYEL